MIFRILRVVRSLVAGLWWQVVVWRKVVRGGRQVLLWQTVVVVTGELGWQILLMRGLIGWLRGRVMRFGWQIFSMWGLVFPHQMIFQMRRLIC